MSEVPMHPENSRPNAPMHWSHLLAPSTVDLEGLLEIKDTHRPLEGPMLLGIDLL